MQGGNRLVRRHRQPPGPSQSGDAVAGLIDQTRSDHHLVGALAQADGDLAGHGGVFAASAVRPLMIASTATLWAVSPVSTMMSASP